MTKTAVTLFSDGSCRGNPGPGGCCAVMQAGGREKVLVGGDDWTTNNRMELTAVLMGLQALKRPCAVTVVTDSQYVVTILRACTERSRNGGQIKANRDLVQQVRTAAAAHTVTAQWVAGHSGHELNERCHRLAYAEATRRLAGASARLSTGASARLSTGASAKLSTGASAKLGTGASAKLGTGASAKLGTGVQEA